MILLDRIDRLDSLAEAIRAGMGDLHATRQMPLLKVIHVIREEINDLTHDIIDEE